MFGLFKKTPDVVEDEASEADLEAAQFIQQKAQFGIHFAELMADPNEDHVRQRDRYEKLRDGLLIRLDAIDDEFCRGFAAHQLIKMCMAAGDRAVALALLAGVRDEFLREKIIETAPELKV